MSSSSPPRVVPVARRPVDLKLLEPPTARRVEPVSRRGFRPARNRRDDEVAYSLAPPRPIEGQEMGAPARLRFGRARIRLWTILGLVAPARGFGVRSPRPGVPRKGAPPEDALHIVEVVIQDQTEEVTLLPIDPDEDRGGRGRHRDPADRGALMDDDEDTHVMSLPAPIFAAPARAPLRGAISFG